MIAQTILNLISLVSVAGHFIVIFRILPLKRSLHSSIIIYALYTATIFIFSYFLYTEITVTVNLIRGLLFIPIYLFLFQGQIIQKLFAFFLSFLLTAFQAALTLEIARYIAPFGTTQYFICFAVLFCILFFAYLVFLFLFWHVIFRRMFSEDRRTEWILYLLGLLFSFAAITILRITIETGPAYTFLLLFVFWSICILCFAIINVQEKAKKSYEADFAQSVISAGHDHYQKMNEMYDALHILRHDYKYHLNIIGELVNNGDLAEIKRYLSDIQEKPPNDDLRQYCKNPVLNALIVSYAERCANAHIRYSVQLAIPETLIIMNYDMCIILGNLLENAVEACQELEGIAHSLNRDKEIKLAIKTQGAHLAIMVRNSFSGEITAENGQPVSAKKNGGFGLRSVRAVATRYDGTMLTEWDNNTFTAYVMLRADYS